MGEALPMAVAAIDRVVEPTLVPEIMLTKTGELSGRLHVVWPTGKVEPADAEITMVRDGQLVGTAHTTTAGR